MPTIDHYIAKPVEICTHVREVIAILMQRRVLVDGKVRTDKTYPSGFMVISIPKTNENFRLLYDTKDSSEKELQSHDQLVLFTVGVIKNREKHKGSFETIHVHDSAGHEFATHLGNVFTIGKGTKPWVSLPIGRGIKLSTIEEARKRQAAQQASAA